MDKTVIELFAGVGGFRVGLNNVTKFNKKGHAIEEGNFKFVWANQWEPSTKLQHAFDCYNIRFPSEHNSNIDIALVDKKVIPSHSLLCGGFPCQDYSVARSLSGEKGIEGKKGVLWWQIRDILLVKNSPFVLLENVDRLIKSPVKQRGRDFGIILRCLADMGYIVEWRIINAADYGMPQRRRRIYIFAYKRRTRHYRSLINKSPSKIIFEYGIFAKAFPILKNNTKLNSVNIKSGFNDLLSVSNTFKFNFCNTGVIFPNGKIFTINTIPIYENPVTLKDIYIKKVDNQFYLSEDRKKQFEFLRGSKKMPRVDKNTGHEYMYSEGAMSPYDSLDLPGRTMLTSEGTTNRSTHIIKDPKTKQLRVLTPVECERLNQFPDNWTNIGMPKNKRYFMMGNALVCGIVKRLACQIEKIIEGEE